MTMSSHPELDELSAYLDDELAAPERTTLEAHLPACAECRSALDALRATIADLGELPDAVPTEQDSWALRVAIARARTPVKRWQRAAWAAGAVAAVAIAVVAIVGPGGRSANQDLAAREDAGALGAGAPGIIRYDAGDFTAGSAQARLLVISRKTTVNQAEDAALPLAAPAAKGAPSRTAGGGAGQFYSVSGDASDEIDRCVAQIRKSTQEFLQPVEYDVGTFESKPAFLLFFQTSSRYELWVVDQTPQCNVLYFAQAA